MQLNNLKMADPQIYKITKLEEIRQSETINLIASENYASPAVLEAMATIFNSKYAEGYLRKRYYAGNALIDKLEGLALKRLKELFGAEHANVQPFSGAIANMASYFALLGPGDKILAMDLACGGHLTHGAKINFSGQWFHFHFYGVDKKTGRLNYDNVRAIAEKIKPQLIICGFTAYPRIIDFSKFRQIADAVGAYLMVDMAHFAGLVAGSVYPNPVPYADIITATTHKTLRGPRGALILCKKQYQAQVDRAVFPLIQAGPHENIIAAKAVCFGEALKPSFKKYAQQIVKNARVLATELQKYDFDLATGGTDTHLLLIDLRNKKVDGKIATDALEKAGIITNKNMIPYDPAGPTQPSGIRLGTPAVTTRGMKKKEMKKIAFWINEVINNILDNQKMAAVKKEVKNLCQKFPVSGANKI